LKNGKKVKTIVGPVKKKELIKKIQAVLNLKA
jgi:hypothetical protein